MGIAAVISVIHDGKVVLKIMSSCNGNRALSVVGALDSELRLYEAIVINQEPIDAKQVWDVADEFLLGCSDCLCVVTREQFVGPEDHDRPEDRQKHMKTFDDPKFNSCTDCDVSDVSIVITI